MVLVIPPALGEAETLRTLAKAVQDARNTLAFKAENLKKAADEAEAKGDHKRMELARNLLMANRQAAEHIQEAIMGRFRLWDNEPDSET
jgi:hypothetical protein